MYKKTLFTILFTSVMMGACSSEKPTETASTTVSTMPEEPQVQEENTLTEQEQADGWVLLWDGKTTEGWRGAYMDTVPSNWVIEDGLLMHKAADGAESANGGDIITMKQYSNFELELDFNISEGGNSGIKYFVTERVPRTPGSAIGLEYQILDDERHPDAKMGRDGNRTVASLYDLITADTTKPINPPGDWNHARILSQGPHVEHWLNGVKVLEYERGSEEFKQIVEISKYKKFEGFGLADKGHILLQDHGDKVAFKNIKIKELAI